LDEIDELRELNHGLMQDLANAREEITVLCDVVEDATDGANQTLVSEMKVLQQQLGRLETVPQPRAGQRRRGRGGAEPAAADADTSGSGQPEAGQVFDGPFEEDEVLAIIREALRTNRIDLYLQPIVSLPQRRTHFYEAMSRLRTGDGRVLMPQHYLDIAVRKGLIATIDNLLLMRCVQLIRRTQQRQKDVSFFVNISPHTLSDTDFLRQFIDFLESNQGLADRLVFEFTQADVAVFSDSVVNLLRRLADLGFRFSMDHVEKLDLDFLALARRRFRFVKVPARLLLGTPADSGARVHPRDLKAMSDRAEIDLVVDRLESEHDVVEILEYDVDFGQGYVFGEPRPTRDQAKAA